jgi:hypothetical protein
MEIQNRDVKRQKRIDENIIDQVIGEIEQRVGHGQYENCTEDELVICLAWICAQVVENGGLRLLFEQPMPLDENYRRTLGALDLIGAIGAAETLREALSQFPNGGPPLDALERVAQYESLAREDRDRLDADFLAHVPAIARCLVKFIRSVDRASPEDG